MAHFGIRQMFFFFMPATKLEGGDAFFFGCLDLRDEVIVEPEDGNGNPSAPFVPQTSHAALDGDGANPLGVGTHDSRLSLDDPSGGGLSGSSTEASLENELGPNWPRGG